MKPKARTLRLIIVGIITLAACSLAFLKTTEVNLSQGPVAKVSVNASEIILDLNPANPDRVVLEDFIEGKEGKSKSRVTISRTAGGQRLIISQKGIHWENGKSCIIWKQPSRYLPPTSFHVFTNKIFLGRVEQAGGTVQEFYIPKS